MASKIGSRLVLEVMKSGYYKMLARSWGSRDKIGDLGGSNNGSILPLMHLSDFEFA